MRQRIVRDIGSLPQFGFGPRMTMWWGTLGFVGIEGTGFVLAVASYLYIGWLAPHWPIGVGPPPLLWSSLLTVVALASVVPNAFAKKAGTACDLPRAKLWLVVMSVVGVVLVAIRGFELYALLGNVRWDTNAYGSLIWMLLGLHTTHIATDVGDTIVLTVLMFTRHAHGKRFSDVEENAVYWYFVVASWVPIYALLYWGPRL